MGWLITAAVLILLGLLPVSLCLRYEESGFHIWVSVWPFRFALYPGKKKEAGKTKNPEKESVTPEKKKQKKKGGKLSAFLPYFQNAIDIITELRTRATIRQLTFKLLITDGDPCDLAVNYGRAWAVLGNLIAGVESLFRIRKRDVEVECDFLGDENRIYFYMDITVSFARLLYMTIFHGSNILRKYISIMQKERAEYNHE